MDNMSIADAMALRGDGSNGGFADNGAWWIIILFLFLFGNNSFGQAGFGGAATAAAQNEILLGQQFGGINAKLNELGNGICNSTYALNNSVTGEGRALQSQIAECCCENRLATANLGAQLNDQTCKITTAIHAEADATRAMLKDNEIQSLRDKVNDLQRDNALCGVIRYPMQMSYCSPCNPFCPPQNPCGCGCGY